MKHTASEYAVLLALLDEALDLQAEARAGWVDRLPESHAGLRPTLRRMLSETSSQEPAADSGLQAQIAAVVQDAVAQPEAPELKAGEHIGPYDLVREIGRGGMGFVWLADRADGAFKRSVALKLPFVTWADRLGERMGRERDILAGLEHPNIARFYDAGVDSLRRPFMAMEYVEGQAIDVYCRERQLTTRDRLMLVLDVAKAVAYAHSKLVIHRDLKPANILVTAAGAVRLLDFGIAKLLVADASPDAPLTQFAGRALTLDYASPEQIRGERVSTASDVYSLGVVLYELLTGRKPYSLERGDGDMPLAQAILATEPLRPSDAVDGSAARRRLRGDIDTIVLKALKKDPRERYGAVVEFADDIDRYLRGDAVRARPDSAWYRTRKFITRHALPVAVAGAALSAVFVTAAVAVREAQVAESQRDRAVALSARAEAASEFQSMLITEAAQSDKPITVMNMLARSETLAKAEFGDKPEHLAAILGMLGGNYHTMGEDARAEPLLRDALQAVQRSPDYTLRAQLACQHALVIGALGRTEEAKRTLHAVIDDRQTGSEGSAQCLEDLAYVAQNENDASGALKFADLAWQRLQQVPGVSPVAEGVYLGSIGYAHYLNNRNDEANRYYAQALKKFTQAGRARGPEAISVRNNWAIVSDGAGNPKRALELYDEMLQIVEQNGSGAPPPYLIANRARALENIGRYVESLAVYAHCVAISEQVGNSTTTAYCLVGQSSALRELGDLAAAKGYCERASAFIGTKVPAGSPAGAAVQITRGKIALSEGRLGDARSILNEVIDSHPAINATALITRAEVNLSAGRLSEAATDARAALARAQSLQAGLPYSFKSGLAWLVLARVLAAQGERDPARTALESAISHLSGTVDADHPGLRRARQLLAADGAAT
jgi:tetratricopeptide (TPR) repeat protein